MARPLFYKTTDDLKAMVDRNSANAAELKLVMSELRHRNTPSAKALAKRVEELLQAGMVKPARVKTNPKSKHPRTKASRARSVIYLPDESGLTPAPQMSAAISELRSTSMEPKPMTEEQRRTEAEVTALRTRLIDLGKRNPLIAFKHGSRSTSHIRIVDERPDLLLEALEEGPLGFEPLPDEEVTPKDEVTPEFRIAYERARLTDPAFLEATERLGEDEADMCAWQTAERALRHTVRQQLGLPKLDYGKSIDVKALAAAHGFDPSFDLRGSDHDDVEDHHEDDRIRVLLTAKELEKRLKGIYEKYRTHERETGLHTLFLCLGFVQWYEDDESDIQHHAPVLILPVRLEQKVVHGRYEYTLVASNEGLEVNVALQEKMRQHWGLETPALRENEAPESYFIRLKAVLDRGRRLTLRRFATIAVLPFPRMVLWKDLDPAIWSDGAFANHPLLPGLLSARSLAEDPTPLEVPDIDAEPLASTAPPLIQPADASQHAALIDVAAGKSLAIEGPPGTGKSQTITNMIATALRDGKRVLFVAEKQAALSVVASRLRKAGFGPLLLELHGDTAKRDTVYAGLRERFDARPSVDRARLGEARAEVARKRDLIRRYLALITEPLGRLGRNAYQLAWREIRLRKSLPASVEAIADRWTPDKVSELEAIELKERRSALDDFGRALLALRKDGGETRWEGAERLDPFDQRSELAAARAAAVAATDLLAIERRLAELGLFLPPPGGELAAAARQLAGLGLPDTIDDAVLRSALRHPEAARALLDAANRWRTLRQQLDQDVLAPGEVLAAQVDALAQAFAEGEVPDTVAQARERLAALREAETALRTIGEDLTLLAELISLPETLSTTGARVAAGVIDALGRLSSIPAALAAPAMLDPMARAALEREAAAAESIRAEREALEAVLSPEALESDPGELGETADTVERAGFFARLFNGEFKAADRRLKRWVRGGQERTAAVETLRHASRLLRREVTFRQESATQSLFPALLWAGADSAFDAALEVATALQEAQARLRECRAANVLDAWLKLNAADRMRAGDLARAAADALEKAEALGTGSMPWPMLAGAIAAKRAAAERLDATLSEIGARADGMISRDGVDLAARLRNLAAAEAIFAGISHGDGFGWVRSIDQDMSPLTDALGCVAKLSADAGPLPMAAVARTADSPATLLRELIALSPRVSAAWPAWSDACATLRSRTGLDAARFESTWAALSDALAALAADQDGVRMVADLLKYRASVREAGLDPLAQAAVAGEVAPELLPDLYEWLVVQALVRAYVGGSGEELGRLGAFLSKAREVHLP
ncbi:DUF4011 domain-containing protein (plasmid) [Sphingomonas changnyeongensis]|uniref:DUF4011 domain-containing protein n=1 Tax=Sphingomonas changnyeongensis TaxID=2698679 RepID=A0A7Z2S6D9_9SPHN|nr:DUF4011 domain-containing protein [Sphingomonas changnyeongensis]QHL92040.1 DUF4011 domain-containing protein [Sphingomonas changnyeongensis]